jgi:hypothetical protein
MAGLIICMFIAGAFVGIIGYDLFYDFKKNTKQKPLPFKKIIKYRGYDIDIWIDNSEFSRTDKAVFLFDIRWSVKGGYGKYITNIELDEMEQIVQNFITAGKKCIDSLIEMPIQIKKLEKIIDNL